MTLEMSSTMLSEDQFSLHFAFQERQNEMGSKSNVVDLREVKMKLGEAMSFPGSSQFGVQG